MVKIIAIRIRRFFCSPDLTHRLLLVLAYLQLMRSRCPMEVPKLLASGFLLISSKVVKWFEWKIALVLEICLLMKFSKFRFVMIFFFHSSKYI